MRQAVIADGEAVIDRAHLVPAQAARPSAALVFPVTAAAIDDTGRRSD